MPLLKNPLQHSCRYSLGTGRLLQSLPGASFAPDWTPLTYPLMERRECPAALSQKLCTSPGRWHLLLFPYPPALQAHHRRPSILSSMICLTEGIFSVTNHLLVFHVHSSQKDLHDLARHRGETDLPVVPWVFLSFSFWERGLCFCFFSQWELLCTTTNSIGHYASHKFISFHKFILS